MQQITYTHLDGSVVTYTTDTVIAANLLLGNTHSNSDQPLIDWLTSQATTIVNTTVLYNGNQAPITYYYKEVNEEIKDFGLGYWANERLSAEDLAKFQQDQAVWSTSSTPRENDNFKIWWARFVADPHVAKQE